MAEQKTRIILRNDISGNWNAVKDEVVLLKGEVGIEFDPNLEAGYQARVKIGDGVSTWAELKYFGEAEAQRFAKVYQVEVANGADKVAAIEAVVAGAEKKSGDIAIVKELIAEGSTERQYTAFVFNGTDWAAMDGNYNAENVYFSKDLIYTKQIGELAEVPASGSAVLAAKGKNIPTLLTSILAKKKQPTATPPSVSLSGAQSNDDREIGTTINVSGKTLTASLNAGSYTYGPATGVTVATAEGDTGYDVRVSYTQGKSGEIARGTSASLPYGYTFQLGTDGNTVGVKFEATIKHTAGVVAKDSFGDASSPEVKIAAGSKSNSSTVTYTSYRKMFYGTRTDNTELDSAKIRALTGIKESAKANNSLSVSVPVGAKRVVIAVPSNRSVTSVKDVNDSSAEIISAFETKTIQVEGAESYTAVDYKVYICDYANAATAANTYKVTIA